MKKYLVYVTTTLERVYEVEADSADEAAHIFSRDGGEYVTEFLTSFDDEEIVDIVEED